MCQTTSAAGHTMIVDRTRRFYRDAEGNLRKWLVCTDCGNVASMPADVQVSLLLQFDRMPLALQHDVADGKISTSTLGTLPADETVEHQFWAVISKDGAFWAYFPDEVVEETGEAARLLVAGR